MRITHIINPVKVGDHSDLFHAQPVTFESMRVARDFTRTSNSKVDLELVTCQFEEDLEIVPDYFHPLPNLTKSVLDFGTFKVDRKLPLISDILQAAVQYGDWDYMIYSNSDIALMPHFYTSVVKFLEDGYDGIIINRRTISDEYKEVADLPLMFAQIGENHPGYDCFILSKSVATQMTLENVVVGAIKIGLALYLNMRVFCSHFQEIGDQHLTFHLGNDQVWKNDKFQDYRDHNSKELKKVIKSLKLKDNNVERYIKEAFPFRKGNQK